MAECHDEQTRDLFSERGLRCTRQRMELFRALAATKCHPTAEELHASVQDSSPGTSLATVYNTLEVFCQAGICRKIATTEGATRYDADTSSHPHVITEDGRVLDVPAEIGESLLRDISEEARLEIERRLGVKIRRMNIEFLAE